MLGLIVSTVRPGSQQDEVVVSDEGGLLLGSEVEFELGRTWERENVSGEEEGTVFFVFSLLVLLLLLSHLVVVSTAVRVVTVVSVETQLVFTVMDCVTVETERGSVVPDRLRLELFLLEVEDVVGYISVVVVTLVEYTSVPVTFCPVGVEVEELAIGYGTEVPAPGTESVPAPCGTEREPLVVPDNGDPMLEVLEALAADDAEREEEEKAGVTRELPFTEDTVVPDATVIVTTVPTVTVVAVALGRGNGVGTPLVETLVLEVPVVSNTVTTVPVEKVTVVAFDSGRDASEELL